MKKYVFKYKLRLIICILVLGASQMFEILFAFIFSSIVDAALQQDMDTLLRDVIAGVFFVAVSMTLTYSGRKLRHNYMKKSVANLRNILVNKILDFDIDTFHQSNTASYLSILNNDVKVFESDYLGSIPIIIVKICTFVCTMIIFIKINILIACIALFVNIIPVVVMMIMSKRLVGTQKENMVETENYNIWIKDILAGFEVVKSYSIIDLIKKRHSLKNSSVADKQYNSMKYDLISMVLTGGCVDVAFITMMLLSGFLVLQNKISLGIMVATVQLMNYLMNPMHYIAEQFGKFKAANAANKRILDLIAKNPRSVTERRSEISEEFNSLTLKNISFCYPQTDNNVIFDLSYEFKKGKKYAIVGPSGGGKSTLIRLIFGYYTLRGGEIDLNGRNIESITKESLYNYITMIHQDIFLFDDTIKNNITLYKRFSNSEIRDAIHSSELDEKLKKVGMDYMVSENGGNLSGGEKQRISIARAFIRKTPIVLMDEATSNLDNQAAYNVEKDILTREDLTAILVTHKLSGDLLRLYDAILVIKNGKIAESGSFEELMNRKKEFYNLYCISN